MATAGESLLPKQSLSMLPWGPLAKDSVTFVILVQNIGFALIFLDCAVLPRITVYCQF
jgi:hypothetical protein